jgi:hypothetical protein
MHQSVIAEQQRSDQDARRRAVALTAGATLVAALRWTIAILSSTPSFPGVHNLSALIAWSGETAISVVWR